MELDLKWARHSLAHVLAQAVERSVDPAVQLGTGPAVENGFYYDMLFSDGITFGEDQIKPLQKIMEGIVKEWQWFASYTAKNIDDAKALVSVMGQQFKVELLDKFFAANPDAVYTFWYNYVDAQMLPRLEKNCKPEYIAYYKKITAYLMELDASVSWRFVTFIDLCEGGHCETTKDIADGSFMLEKIAGAYRQAKDTNPMMTRIYGLAFADKQALKDHQAMMEEAKKRDHRVLGQKLQLFAFDDEVGPGLPLWLPNGTIIVEELEKLAKEREAADGYQRVRSPHIAKDKLYIRSGHLPYYAESMFPPMEMDGETYYLKAMNCPHHHKIYAATPKSYRDLPVRYGEYGHCYRYEDSGALFGLMRVRSLCMNDAHIYCSEEQFADEFMKVIEMYIYYFKLFGIEKYQMRLSKHSKAWLGKKYVDNEALWIKTEGQVRDVLEKSGVPFFEAEDEAAFYGPKIDVQIWSVIGREFTLATNQLDFAVPERFNLTYVDKDGQDKTPICIHRAPLSTHERFVWFLIEHFAGAFPVWLAPTQVQIVPVADKFIPYAETLHSKLHSEWLRSSVDDSSDSFSKKIRNAELMKVPYIVIVGEEEETNDTVSIRVFKTKEQSVMGAEAFVAQMKKEYVERSL